MQNGKKALIAMSGGVDSSVAACLMKQQGYTLIPLSLYFKGSRVKVQIGLCRGKKLYDKREDAARRDMKREADRALKERNA